MGTMLTVFLASFLGSILGTFILTEIKGFFLRRSIKKAYKNLNNSLDQLYKDLKDINSVNEHRTLN